MKLNENHVCLATRLFEFIAALAAFVSVSLELLNRCRFADFDNEERRFWAIPIFQCNIKYLQLVFLDMGSEWAL